MNEMQDGKKENGDRVDERGTRIIGYLVAMVLGLLGIFTLSLKIFMDYVGTNKGGNGDYLLCIPFFLVGGIIAWLTHQKEFVDEIVNLKEVKL